MEISIFKFFILEFFGNKFKIKKKYFFKFVMFLEKCLQFEYMYFIYKSKICCFFFKYFVNLNMCF